MFSCDLHHKALLKNGGKNQGKSKGKNKAFQSSLFPKNFWVIVT
jgi:hypothetical protein